VNVRIDQQGPIVVWLRKDLRLVDNPALAAAAATGRPVIPLYILDQTPGVRPMGGASLWWLDKSLTALAVALEAIGSRLILRRGPARQVLEDIVAQARPAAVLWNRLYDAAAIDRDSDLKAWLKDEGVACESFNAGLLNEPWTVKNGAGQPYKVFTPYWRAAREQLHRVHVEAAPNALAPPRSWPRTETLESWALHPTRPDWSRGFDLWTPGEAGAVERLDDFLSDAVEDYDRRRNLPGVEATSRLSPHLHFGEIGPRQVLANNVGNWQWVAGSGADAAPYFRIFNPIAQGQKFDPAGTYVRRWVPELASLPDALIHEPWKASAQLTAAAGRIYGEPIVGHPAARERALAAYRGLKGEEFSREGR
jgi:deoxyribodipyrimidine photo-lyase